MSLHLPVHTSLAVLCILAQVLSSVGGKPARRVTRGVVTSLVANLRQDWIWSTNPPIALSERLRVLRTQGHGAGTFHKVYRRSPSSTFCHLLGLMIFCSANFQTYLRGSHLVWEGKQRMSRGRPALRVAGKPGVARRECEGKGAGSSTSKWAAQ